jgi:hypothetical protein
VEQWICDYRPCSRLFWPRPSQRNCLRAYCSRDCAVRDRPLRSRKTRGDCMAAASNNRPDSFCHCGREKDFRARQCAVCAGCSYPKGMKNRRVSDRIIAALLAQSESYLSVANELGTSRARVRRVAENCDISVEHLVHGRGRPAASAEVLVLNPSARNNNPLVRRILLREDLLPYICQTCGLGPRWNDQLLVLQLDHINGISRDSRLENLRFLCPTCHSQTPTYKGGNVWQRRQARLSQ